MAQTRALNGFGRWHRTTLAAAMTTAMLLVAACGSGSDDDDPEPAETGGTVEAGTPLEQLEQAAAEEGQLHWYTSMDPETAENVSRAFGEKYDIDVQFTRLVSGPLTARYAAEAQAGNFTADAMLISDYPFFDQAVENGWMMSVEEADYPNVGDLPEEYVRENSVATGFSVYGVVVNTDNVEESDMPETWEDLLDSRWDDNIYTHDPRSVTVALAYWDLLGETYGDDYVTEMGKKIEVIDSMVTGAQLVAAGEHDLAIGVSSAHISPLLAEAPDAPITLRMLDGVSFGGEWNAAVSTESAHPNAGRLLVNWFLTEEGQQVLNAAVGPSVLPGVEIEGFEPLGEDFVSLDLPKATESRAEILGLLGIAE